jgi:hypothetical protein
VVDPLSSPGKPCQNIQLRGHHLLCLLGFRGLGYSERFVENMGRVAQAVVSHSATIKVVDHCDIICSACPHFTGERCDKKKGPASQVRVRDLKVIDKLGLQVGAEVPARELWARVRRSVAPRDLHGICTDCEWLEPGYCADGLR